MTLISELALITVTNSKRTILEFLVKNHRKESIATSAIVIAVVRGNSEVKRNTLIFEKDEIPPGETVSGRLIVTGENAKGASVVVGYGGRKAKIQGGLN